MGAEGQVQIALPAGLEKFAGRITDCDSHEMMPAQVWVSTLGDITAELADHWINQTTDHNRASHPSVPGYQGDVVPIEASSIWGRKGPTAPGAVDLSRRTAVMDMMGVKRQLMYPTGVGLYGTTLAHLCDSPVYAKGIGTDYADRRRYGLTLVRAYNEWVTRATTDRVRAVYILFEESVEALLASARKAVANGIRAIVMPPGELPGGRSPAHPDLDPLWQLMADNKVAVTLHIQQEENIFGSREWNNAPAFEGYKVFDEFKLDPWSRSTMYVVAQNFLTTMVLGGVFERHPTLRFGIIELGAFWIGPLCDTLDYWYNQDPGDIHFSTGRKPTLTMAPSRYIKRNVRVTPYDSEMVSDYIRKYGLEDVLCFATDYPHIEGGKDPAGVWYRDLAPLGPEVVEKFFVTNGEWLLPD